MSVSVLPIYIVSVNNTPQVAKKLVGVLIEVCKLLHIALVYFGLFYAGSENAIQFGPSRKHR